MAFISNYPDFPFFMTKLLIPTVSGYHDHPEGFLYPRITALYAHLNFVNGGTIKMDWTSSDLTRFWGQANKHSADNYTKLLEMLI